MIPKVCTKCGAKWLFGNDNHNECPECDGELRRETNADRTEELLEFAKWVAKEVCIPDYEWKNNFWAFQEIACRRLVKLGIIQEREDKYIYEYEEEDGE